MYLWYIDSLTHLSPYVSLYIMYIKNMQVKLNVICSRTQYSNLMSIYLGYTEYLSLSLLPTSPSLSSLLFVSKYLVSNLVYMASNFSIFMHRYICLAFEICYFEEVVYLAWNLSKVICNYFKVYRNLVDVIVMFV